MVFFTVCEGLSSKLYRDLINLLNGGAGAEVSEVLSALHAAVATGPGHAALGALVEFGDDGVAYVLQLLLLVAELVLLCHLVGVQPLEGLVAAIQDGLAVVVRDLAAHLRVFDRGLHV